MLLEECRPLNGGRASAAGFVPVAFFGPLRALTAPGALERRPGGLEGDKSGLLMSRLGH